MLTSHIFFGNDSENKPVNVGYIAKNDLCIGCGICEASCPNDAVKVVFSEKKGMALPTVDDKLCSQCHLCLSVCYGYGVDKDLNPKIFHRYPASFAGNLIECYLGYASDSKLRFECTSGGAVSAVLTHALTQGLIDGAIVTRMETGNPPEMKAFVAATIDEVFAARGSKYCPVSFAKCLEKLERRKRYAVVGLPCHLYGIRKLAESNSKIRNSVSLYIGILCGGMPSYLGTRYILRSYNMENHHITRFEYRGGGWPGRLLIQDKESASKRQSEIRTPYPEYWHNTFGFFIPFRCTLCHDGFNEFSDVSFGDAWLPDLTGNNNKGISLIIARTGAGKHLVLDAFQKKVIQLDSISTKVVAASQRGLMHFKFRTLRARFNLCKTLRRKLPILDLDRNPTARFGDYLYATNLYLGRILASRRNLWWLLNIYASGDSLLGFARNYASGVKNRAESWIFPR